MLKKGIQILTLTATIGLATFTQADAYNITKENAFTRHELNGQVIENAKSYELVFDYLSMNDPITDYFTYVSLTPYAKALGMDISYANHVATFKNKDIEVKADFQNKKYFVNGTEITWHGLDDIDAWHNGGTKLAPPVVIDGTTYVPIRFIERVFGTGLDVRGNTMEISSIGVKDSTHLNPTYNGIYIGNNVYVHPTEYGLQISGGDYYGYEYGTYYSRHGHPRINKTSNNKLIIDSTYTGYDMINIFDINSKKNIHISDNAKQGSMKFDYMNNTLVFVDRAKNIPIKVDLNTLSQVTITEEEYKNHGQEGKTSFGIFG